MAAVALDCVVTGNEARAGEWLAGQFLAGYDPNRLVVGITNVQFVPVQGGISGQAAVSTSLAVTRGVAVSVGSSAERALANTTPPNNAVGNNSLGLRFTVTANGQITHVRYFSFDGVSHPVTLYDSVGTALATAVDPANAGGWREVPLPTPVTVVAGQTYTAAVRIDTNASFVYGTFAASTAPHLTALGGYWATGVAFPSNSGSNYYVDVVFLTGVNAVISAQADRTRDGVVSVAGSGALAAQTAPGKGFIATVVGASALVAQENPFRGFAATVAGFSAVAATPRTSTPLAAAVAGQAAVSADIIRVGVTVSFACTVARAASVAPSMAVTNASFVNLDADVHGQAAVVAQDVKTVSFGCTVAGVAALAPAVTLFDPLADNVAGAALVSPSLTVTSQVFTTFGCVVAGQAAVGAGMGKVIPFACAVGTTPAPDERMLDNTVPQNLRPADTWTTGARFTVGSDGLVTHIRYYAAAAGPYALSLWDAGGTKLRGMVDNAPGTGWREIPLLTPLPVVSGGVYTVSMDGTNDCYSIPTPASISSNLTNYVGMYVLADDSFPFTFADGYYYHVDVVYHAGVGAAANAVITPSLSVGHTVSFGCAVAGQASVGADLRVTKIVLLEARIETIIPICGEVICGTFVCGGSSGPHALVTSGIGGPSVTKVFSASVEGQAQVAIGGTTIRSLSVEVGGHAQVVVETLGLQLSLASQIVGDSEIFAKLTLDWLGPTSPGDILLPPTQEEDFILTPTDPESVFLVSSFDGDEDLDPTQEEDWLLVPTTEKTM